MLRSTSVKQEAWKPVKLLAKQPVKDKIISLECDTSGRIAVALTKSAIYIFNERELLNTIEIAEGYQLKICSNLENIFVLTSESLLCFDYWGKEKWSYKSDGLIDDFTIDPLGKNIALRGEKFVVFLNRFGDFEADYSFSDSLVKTHFTSRGNFLVGSSNQIYLLNPDNKFDKLLEISDQKRVFFSDDGGISLTEHSLFSFSLTGHIIWEKQLSNVNTVKFSNRILNNYFLENGKKLVCQDRNGEKLWSYSSDDELEDFMVLNSGMLIGLYAKNNLHILDDQGDQAWSYYAREKIVDFSFSRSGGDVILASESKIHWFQNEGFLRNQVNLDLKHVESLISKVSAYELNMGDIEDNFTLIKEQSGGNFVLLKKSFNKIVALKKKLEQLHSRHVNYLDSLPQFMDLLALQGAQTDEMIPLIYPYFSLYGDIEDNLTYSKLIEFGNHLLLKLDRYDLTKIKHDSLFDQKDFIRDAMNGINKEIENINKLIIQSENDLKKLRVDVNSLIINWLESGIINDKIEDFYHEYVSNIATRTLKTEVIHEKMESHMAFVDYNTSDSQVELHRKIFKAKKEVDLKLDLLNNSDSKLENINIRAKIQGGGLELQSPPSGVIRINHLKPGEVSSITFTFYPSSRANTRVILVIQYFDSVGRKCTYALGNIRTNFLGCYVRPLNISESEHETERLKLKDHTSHTTFNIEGLQISKITKIAKGMPGLYLCNAKEESTRSIIYHAGESTLEGSKYFSMIFLRKLGEIESLRVALELICHSTDIDKSSELKEEMSSYLKNKLLELNAKFV